MKVDLKNYDFTNQQQTESPVVLLEEEEKKKGKSISHAESDGTRNLEQSKYNIDALSLHKFVKI